MGQKDREPQKTELRQVPAGQVGHMEVKLVITPAPDGGGVSFAIGGAAFAKPDAHGEARMIGTLPDEACAHHLVEFLRAMAFQGMAALEAARMGDPPPPTGILSL